MDGKGIVTSLGVALRHFFGTYVTDIRATLSGKKRYYTPEGIAERSSAEASGIFTIQYPEEKLPVPEEFRFIPFLVYDEGPQGEKNVRCTSCGICAKVCPPQCIWITRSSDPVTGKPVPAPAQFAIDVDVCMNCGLCAEFCPFDAIKMDHDYEITTYSRERDNIYKLDYLLKPASYYAGIRPTNYAREEAARQAEKEAKAAKKAGTAAAN